MSLPKDKAGMQSKMQANKSWCRFLFMFCFQKIPGTFLCLHDWITCRLLLQSGLLQEKPAEDSPTWSNARDCHKLPFFTCTLDPSKVRSFISVQIPAQHASCEFAEFAHDMKRCHFQRQKTSWLNSLQMLLKNGYATLCLWKERNNSLIQTISWFL